MCGLHYSQLPPTNATGVLVCSKHTISEFRIARVRFTCVFELVPLLSVFDDHYIRCAKLAASKRGSIGVNRPNYCILGGKAVEAINVFEVEPQCTSR